MNQLSFRIIALGLAALLLAGTAHAVIIVDGTGDEIAADGVCTLREAITAINSGTEVNECDASGGADTIFIEAGGTITLQSALPALESMTILGNGHAVSGDDAVRVFRIASGADVVMEDITITNGNAGSGNGGGIQLSNGGTLTLTRCVISDNTANAGGGLRSQSSGATNTVTITDCLFSNNQSPTEGGGGINNDLNSTMTITRSTIAGNSGRFAGGIANYNGAVMTIRNSTVSGNSCTDPGSGGGVENFNGGSTLTIENSTITANSCDGTDSGGGIFNNTTAPALINTIVAGNTADRPDLSGSFTSNGHNLIGNDTGSSGFVDGDNGDQVGSASEPIDPMLDELADNGGPTPTHALLAGSPAIDSGDNDTAPSTDQRGAARIRNNIIDIGAFEFCHDSIQVNTTTDDGPGSLRQSIASVCAGGTIDFAGSLANETIGLTSGQLVIEWPVNLVNPLAPDLSIDANDNSRVFLIQSGSEVLIEDLLMGDGNAGSGSSDRGGAIRVNNNARLTLNRCSITNSHAYAGGGLYSSGPGAVVQITDCVVQGNQTPNEGGGGINNDDGSTMTITRSTIAGNSGRFAGGIANYNGAVMTIRNSTISGNSCTDASAGGGVENYDGGSTLVIENSTITGNSCDGANSGGGIFNNTTAPALINTIVAGNTADRPDLSGSFTSNGHNLIGDDTGSSGFVDGNNGNQVGSASEPIDPMLEELADNGGSTPTHALLAGSPAIDSGDNDTAPSTDQRGAGFPRIVQGTIDIGAFERCDPLPLITTSIESGLGEISPDSASVACGDTTAFTITPDPGYSIDAVGGTCPAELNDDVFTTDPITQDCQVVAHFSQDPVDAQCGAADGETFTSAPTEALCDIGQASAVGGDGPWYWSCQGIAGGADANCSAEIQHYPLTYLAGDNGEILGDSIQSIPHGGSGEAVTAAADDGYAFAGWSDGDASNPRTDTDITDDLTVQANFLEQAAIAFYSDSNLSLINEAVTFTFEVVGAHSATQDGAVMIEADSGESCAGEVIGTVETTTTFECEIVFSEAGIRTLTATFDGSSTHQPAASDSLTQRAVESFIIFRDRFETAY